MLITDYINDVILIISTQYPSKGGAATIAYELHKFYIKNGLNSTILFIDKHASQNCNPDNIKNTYGFNMKDPYMNIYLDKKRVQNHINAMIKLVNMEIEPKYVVGFNYVAPIVGRYMFKKSKIFYAVTGSALITSEINNDNIFTVPEYLSKPYNPNDSIMIEELCITLSDHVIPNSNLMKNVMLHQYPMYVEKIGNVHDFHYVFTNIEEVKNCEKEYDIAFVVSSMGRKIKGGDKCLEIINSYELNKYKKLCIGSKTNEVTPNNVTMMGNVSRNEVLNLLSKTKILIVTSYFESYGMTTIEASCMGCLVVTSSNTGTSEFVNKFFVMNDLDTDKWINKLKTILENYDYFRKIYSINYKCDTNIYPYPEYSLNVRKYNVLLMSVDYKEIGGAGTNTFFLMEKIKKSHNVFVIFMHNEKIDNLDENVFIINQKTIDKDMEIVMKHFSDNKIHIDLVFAKNYKMTPIIKKYFNDAKKIFSPSGMRSVTASISKDHCWVVDYKNNPVIEKTFDDCDLSDLSKFVKIHDTNLDSYALQHSDYIVPNSMLTYDILKAYDLGKDAKMLQPIYITNINGLKRKEVTTFAKRPIDILFVSYDWKRTCKNYKLVCELIPMILNKNKNIKIMVVGRNQKKDAKFVNSIKSHDNLTHEELVGIYNDTKVVVIPSYFDSNPNVCIEAINNGCNVVLSENVGCSTFIDSRSIVSKYKDISEWLRIVMENIMCKIPYNTISTRQIRHQLNDLFDRCMNDNMFNEDKQVGVGVFRVCNLWDAKVPTMNMNGYEFKYTNGVFDDIGKHYVSEVVGYDIYFLFFLHVSKNIYNNEIHHYIKIADDSVNENICYEVNKLFPYIPNNVFIWKIKDLESLMQFKNNSIYFFRGTYHVVYNELSKGSKSIYYPATSLSYSNIKKNASQPLRKNNLLIQLKTNCAYSYDYTLIHEDANYALAYKNTRLMILTKFSSEYHVCKNGKRENDFCFIGTEKQQTKNHELFFGFLDFLERHKIPLRIIYVGSIKDILSCDVTRVYERLRYVKLIVYTNLDQQAMIDKVYNTSKINILFSGRECDPRVLHESAACGCYNVALDTLSDGKYVYNDIKLGKLVGDKNWELVAKKANSIAYANTDIIWMNVYNIWKSGKFDHFEISTIYKNRFNLLKCTDFRCFLDDKAKFNTEINSTSNILIKVNTAVNNMVNKMMAMDGLLGDGI